MGKLLAGGIHGIVATIVMSGVFLAGQRLGTIGTLPPRLIVEKTLPGVPAPSVRPVSTVAHFAYGAGAGAVFGLLGRRGIPAGVLYGLAVWAASYEAWVPAAGVIPPAHRDDRPRAATILAAHAVYGLTLGLLARGRR